MPPRGQRQTQSCSAPEKVRLEVEVRLKRAVPDVVWDRLVERNYVAEVINGERGAWELLLPMARDLLAVHDHARAVSTAPRRRTWTAGEEVEEATNALRAQAIAELVAAEASTNSSVHSWRQNVLQGRYPLSPEEVDAWIKAEVYGEQRGRLAPGPTAYVDVPIPWDVWVQARVQGMRQLPSSLRPEDVAHARFRYLRIHLSDGTVQEFPTYRGGELESLRRLSEELSASYPWTAEDAADWILTGKTPPMHPLTKTLRGHPNVPELGRLVIQVDPHVSPPDVATYYARARQAYWREWGGKTGQTRERAHTSPRLEMVIFVAPRLAKERDTTHVWTRLWEEWNATHPYPLRQLGQPKPAGHSGTYAGGKEMRGDFYRARRQLLGTVATKTRRAEDSGTAVEEA